MTLVDSIKRLVGGEERTFEYVCANCEAEFESIHSDMSKVSCPECRGTEVR